MSERIITLFGEEIVPEQPKAAGKTRAKKKPQETSPDITNPQKEEPKAKEEPETRREKETTPVNPEPPKENSDTHHEPHTHITEEASHLNTEPENENIEVYEVSNAAEEVLTQPANIEPEIEAPVTNKKAEKTNLPDDWEGDKQYYSIGEVAALFKVKTSHIRFWTNEFKLKVRTTRKGDRLYTPEQIKELRAIHHLVKERGFTLSGAKAKMKTQNKMDVETIDLKQSLLQLRAKLVSIKNRLK